MVSQERVGASSVEFSARSRPRLARALRLLRNSLLIVAATLMTGPVSAVVIHYLPYWALPVENRDGSSAQEAVIVHASDEMEGVRVEYAYASYHLNPFTTQFVSQDLVYQDGKPYDVLHYQDRSGRGRAFWFDISEWFGVWGADS